MLVSYRLVVGWELVLLARLLECSVPRHSLELRSVDNSPVEHLTGTLPPPALLSELVHFS
jgi:hypothetical protein